MKTPKSKLRFFFLACLRWRYPRINIQISTAGERGYHPGWWELRINPRHDPYWQGLLDGFNLPVTLRALLSEMGVPKMDWDFGPCLGETLYVHLDPKHWNKRLA